MDVLNDKISNIELFNYYGSDQTICEMARVTRYLDKVEPDPIKDEKLIRYLWENKHTSPFEHCSLTFYVKCPIFVARQWHRHRTQSYSERSGRMTEMPEEFYVPSVSRFTTQSASNKQASSDTPVEFPDTCHELIKQAYTEASQEYKSLIDLGVSKEIARIVLPLSTYTEFYATANLNNWLRFVTLRDSDHAQWEIRQYARYILAQIVEKFPMVGKAYEQRL